MCLWLEALTNKYHAQFPQHKTVSNVLSSPVTRRASIVMDASLLVDKPYNVLVPSWRREVSWRSKYGGGAHVFS